MVAEDDIRAGVAEQDVVPAAAVTLDASNADAFTKIYDEWTGEHADFEQLVYERKKLILEISLASE